MSVEQWADLVHIRVAIFSTRVRFVNVWIQNFGSVSRTNFSCSCESGKVNQSLNWLAWSSRSTRIANLYTEHLTICGHSDFMRRGRRRQQERARERERRHSSSSLPQHKKWNRSPRAAWRRSRCSGLFEDWQKIPKEFITDIKINMAKWSKNK